MSLMGHLLSNPSPIPLSLTCPFLCDKDCTGFIPPAQTAGVLSGLFWVMRLSAFYEIWLHCQQHSSEEDEEYSDSQSLILAAIAYC